MWYRKLVLLTLVALAAAAPLLKEEDFQFLFTKWMVQHSKSYEIEEFFQRYGIFKSNLNFVREHNDGNRTYTVAMNQFGDLTSEEFAKRNVLRVPEHILQGTPDNSFAAPLPSVDWRSSGAVTPVKDQGQCGSCYAFSATGALEGAYKNKKGVLISLSEQNIVDCSRKYDNDGCGGGVPSTTFDFIRDNGGIASEAAYPYFAKDNYPCKTTVPKAVSCRGHVEPAQNEAALDAALRFGPVSVAIEADTQPFQFYSKGVFSNAACGTKLDHAVLLVGSGVSGSQYYWIVKNSWNTNWGEAGYIRMNRGMNLCGINLMTTYPTI
jgi:cathepsin L